jgi:hypothetical protein
MKYFEIFLEKNIYSPGGRVNGSVILRNDKPISARDVTLKISGLERTSIEVGDDEDSITYHSYNYIFEITDILAGSGELPPGEHRSTFSFKIPEDSIPSYNGSNVDINYFVRAQVDIPFWFDLKAEKEFYILYHPDIIRSWAKPVSFASAEFHSYDSKYGSDMGLFGPKSPKPSFLIELDRDTYFVGEEITGRIIVKNKSDKTIRKVKLLLRAKEYAWADGYSRYITKEKHKFKIQMYKISEGQPSPFKITIPRDVRSSFKGMYSRLDWFIEAQLDIAFGFDIKAKQQIAIYQWSH